MQKLFNKVKRKIFFGITGALLFSISLSYNVPLNGQDISSIQAQLSQINSQITGLQQDVTNNQNQVNSLLGQKSSLQSNLGHIQSLINSAQQKEDQINSLINSLQGLQDAAQAELTKKIALKDISFANLYETSQDNAFFDFMSAPNAQAFLYKVALNEASVDGQKQDIILLTSQINSLNNSLTQEKHEKDLQDAQISTLNSQKAQLQRELASVQYNYNTASQKIVADQGQINNLQSQFGQLSTEEQQIILSKLSASGGSQSGGISSQSYGSSYNPSGSAGIYQVKIKVSGSGQSVSIGSNLQGPITIVPRSINSVSNISGGSSTGSYTGDIEFRGNTNVNFIEQTSIENYVAGMGEMPSNWDLSALESQAVAARTYALYNKGAYGSSEGYDIPNGCYGQSVCQSYDGYHTGGMQTAEANTAGQVLESGGSFADTVYSANNGGYERSSAEVWGGSKTYLPSQSDIYNGQQVNNYNDPTGMCPGEYYGPAGPSTSGSGVLNISGGAGSFYDIAGIAEYLKQGNSATSINTNGDYSSYITNKIGSLTGATFYYSNGQSSTANMSDSQQENIANSLSGNSDYVKSVTLNGSSGSESFGLYTGDINYIHEAFNLASPGKDVLYTPVWFFTYNGGSSVQFFGFGFGHTVGMSQCGAEGRAHFGQSYSGILSFYYPGTSLTTDTNITGANAEGCNSYGVHFPNNDVCIRVGIDGYSGNDNTVTENDNYTLYINGIGIYQGGSGDTIEVIQN